MFTLLTRWYFLMKHFYYTLYIAGSILPHQQRCSYYTTLTSEIIGLKPSPTSRTSAAKPSHIWFILGHFRSWPPQYNDNVNWGTPRPHSDKHMNYRSWWGIKLTSIVQHCENSQSTNIGNQCYEPRRTKIHLSYHLAQNYSSQHVIEFTCHIEKLLDTIMLNAAFTTR